MFPLGAGRRGGLIRYTHSLSRNCVEELHEKIAGSPFKGDAVRLAQLLANLTRNAIVHGAAGERLC